jgi:hypothetical protein
MENDDILASPESGASREGGSARHGQTRDMFRVTVWRGSKERKFTLIQGPLPRIGDMVTMDGKDWEVTKLQKLSGTVLKLPLAKTEPESQSVHVERATSGGATTSGEAKPSKRGTSGFGSTGR